MQKIFTISQKSPPLPPPSKPERLTFHIPASMSERHVVCRVSELPPGERKIVEIGKRSIGVFNIAGEFFAILNLCPHQLAPLCKGKITGTNEHGAVGEYPWTRQGEIIRCPWHGWEFDIKTGRSIFNPHRVRTRSYAVEVSTEAESSIPPAPATCASECTDAKSVESFPVEVDGDDWVVLLV